ncbi:PAS domain S-box protein [Pseudodesulfovibrio tunisiensis]|uniref:PAS domain S-box protein n=1 Tax=Pseudodesulfovibrio tunisiensis TaxID=463192 RepID=UPI001FB47A67|nr:PAS domain S-box protein [Pseudodesulfovibrio tunisiensis]
MKNNARILFAFCLAVFLLCPGTGTARAEQGKRKQILLLNSYHQNFHWTEELLRAVTDVLRPKETGILLHVENMDTKRVLFGERYMRQLAEVFAHKYRDTPLDLILATDNNAFEFLRRYHATLFPGVPVVFCGVNFFKPEQLDGYPLFTGVTEEFDARGTLEMALRLHPNTRRVFVVNDYTPSGRAWADNIREQLRDFPPGVDIQYNGNLTTDDLLKQVRNLPPGSIVLLGIFFRDRDGRFLDVGEAAEALSSYSRFPVYGLLDYDLNHGIIGGMLASNYAQGQTMAQMALHVLSGRNPRNIPVIRSTWTQPMFDYAMLRHFNISIARLPEDSEIINRPRTLYSEYRDEILTVLVLGGIQTAIIVFLVVTMNRRRELERDLRRAHQDLELRVEERTREFMESEAMLRTVFNASHDALILHSVSGQILEVNDRMLKMYGVSEIEASELSLARDYSSRENPLYRLSSIWRSVINGRAQAVEWKARRPHDGHEFDVEMHMNRITYKGTPAILANVRDITVRKETETRIRQSLSKFEAILENSLVGIAMTRNRVISTINKRGAEIFGYASGELAGSDLFILLNSTDDMDMFMRASRDALETSGEFYTEQTFRAKGGREIWCRMYAKAIDPAELGKGVIWAWDNVTEQRLSQEELLRAREDAVAANRAKSEFLASMSHEIRTPMNAIVGMTDILLQTRLSGEQKDYLRTVKDSAEHLLEIINDILDLSKIEARKLELDKVDFDLPFHLRNTLKGMEVQAHQKGLALDLAIDADVPKCVNGDPVSLRQVVVNLVGNAIKFTRRGNVRIRVSRAADEARPKDDPRDQGIFVSVRDTGIGIPEEFLESIFQSFSQTTRAFGGTGLGLAISRKLIRLMGGDVSVQSKVGTGSTFSFTVWFTEGHTCPAPEPAPEPAPRPVNLGRPVRILLAEDNEVNVMVTTLRLEELGYEYDVASTGLEVLALLKEAHYDLVLMDVEMPVLDGIAATKAVRSAKSGGPIRNPNIPIVGVTAHALKEFRDRCLKAGMNAYVAKPVDFIELTGIINRLVGDVAGATDEPPTATGERDAVAADPVRKVAAESGEGGGGGVRPHCCGFLFLAQRCGVGA